MGRIQRQTKMMAIFDLSRTGPNATTTKSKTKISKKLYTFFYNQNENPRRKCLFNFRFSFDEVNTLKWRGKISLAKRATRTSSPLEGVYLFTISTVGNFFMLLGGRSKGAESGGVS